MRAQEAVKLLRLAGLPLGPPEVSKAGRAKLLL